MYRTPSLLSAALVTGLALAGAPAIGGPGPMELGTAPDGLLVAGRYGGKPGYRGNRPVTLKRGQTELSALEATAGGEQGVKGTWKRRPMRHGPPGKGHVRY